MYKAYIMVVTFPEKTKEVFESLTNNEQIEEVHEVMGPYDIVIEVRVKDLAQLPDFITALRKIEGVEQTMSLVTFPES